MAKLTGKYFKEVARIKFSAPVTGIDAELFPGTKWTGILVVRSDGYVLRRWTGDGSTGYSRLGKLKPGAAQDKATLARIAEKRGWKVEG